MTDGEAVIIVRADLGANPGGVRVDVGNLSPFVAALILEAAVDALTEHDPVVTVIHDDDEISTSVGMVTWEDDDDD